jgi:hypothetical protein
MYRSQYGSPLWGKLDRMAGSCRSPLRLRNPALSATMSDLGSADAEVPSSLKSLSCPVWQTRGGIQKLLAKFKEELASGPDELKF